MDDLIRQRAQHFGRGDAHGGWLFAADVACSVERGTGQGERTDIQPRRARAEVDKVSASEFAQAAGGSHDRVLRYLDAWDAAAADGLVATAADLQPGDQPGLPDAERWSDYFSPTTRRIGRDRVEAVREQAREDGLSPRSVLATMGHTRALRSAILADEATAAAAQSALAERDQARLATPPEPRPHTRPAPRNYDRLVEQGVNAISVALAAEANGLWTPDGMSDALLYFLGQKLLDRQMPEGNFDDLLARVENYANQEAAS
jgi:hypothetical protein